MYLCQDLVKNWIDLFIRTIFKNSLNYSTSISMNAEFGNSICDSLHNEVNRLIRHFLNTLLNHMIAILIIDAIQDRVF